MAFSAVLSACGRRSWIKSLQILDLIESPVPRLPYIFSKKEPPFCWGENPTRSPKAQQGRKPMTTMSCQGCG